MQYIRFKIYLLRKKSCYMKTYIKCSIQTRILIPVIFFMAVNFSFGFQTIGTESYNEYRGEVVNSQNGNPVASAYLMVNGTNISTITNNDGKFSLKLPEDLSEAVVTVTSLGFQSKSLPLSYFKPEDTRIELNESIEELSQVSLFNATDPKALVRSMLDRRGNNYLNEETSMTAFYRETIKRGRRNVSLSEAVLKLYKQPNNSTSKDEIALIKARKSADYDRLDTLALKLRGGPFNALYLDVMKYPDFLFNRAELDNYTFSFAEPAKINNRFLYVVDFKQKNRETPWYYGTLFIDAQTSTLVRANYSLNVDNRSAASGMFVKKKPGRARVYPVSVDYRVDYRESNGKWYYGYGNAALEFVVNWKRKLFNSRYTVNSEMAVTDWEINPVKLERNGNFLNPAIVMADDVSGFADVDFWGDTNIIEPEKSIQNAIDKIQKQLMKDNN